MSGIKSQPDNNNIGINEIFDGEYKMVMEEKRTHL